MTSTIDFCWLFFLAASIIFYQTCGCWKEGNWKLAVTLPLQILIAWVYRNSIQMNSHPPTAPKLPSRLTSIWSDPSWTPWAPRRHPSLLLSSIPAHVLVSSSICRSITSLVKQAIRLLLPELDWPHFWGEFVLIQNLRLRRCSQRRAGWCNVQEAVITAATFKGED